MSSNCSFDSDNSSPRSSNKKLGQPAPLHSKILKQNSFYIEDIILNDVNRVKNILTQKDAIITALQQEIQRLSSTNDNNLKALKRSQPLSPFSHLINEEGISRVKLGRMASTATFEMLSQLPSQPEDEIAKKIIQAFNSPYEYVDYYQQQSFAYDICALCKQVQSLFEVESRCLFLQSPLYVLGDIHGNLEDLHFFADNIWRLGVELTAGKFLFLGDYVDRGLNSLECVAYLFAMKLQNPDKVFLLRGNHETRDVNGWEDYYAEKSFLFQCKNRFGQDLGYLVWEEINSVFDRLPLAAVIDHNIFCVHGGIPRPVAGFGSQLQAIMDIPTVASIAPPSDQEKQFHIQLAMDCIWSDPADDTQEGHLDNLGYGESVRGGGISCYGNEAITNFLNQNALSYVIRAHEAHGEGVQISKNARVLTVFSTSKDHGQGRGAMAGCILVDFHHIRVINRSPLYKNQYIHRRDSVSLIGIPEFVLDECSRLGLIIDADEEDEEEQDEEQQGNEEQESFISEAYSDDQNIADEGGN